MLTILAILAAFAAGWLLRAPRRSSPTLAPANVRQLARAPGREERTALPIDRRSTIDRYYPRTDEPWPPTAPPPLEDFDHGDTEDFT